MDDSQSASQPARLSAAKLALLEKRLGRTFSEAAAPGRIPRREGAARAPLSFQQQRQWLLLEREGLPSFYNNAARLTGFLDASAFRRAFDEVVARHEILRTTFAVEDGRPVQVIHPPRPSNMGFADLSSLSAAEREERAARLSAEQARPFDLARGPVFRATLLRLGDGDHLLLFTLLHLVADRWSIKVLTQEMGALYHAFAAGRPAPLPELPIQYGDYASWQRRQLEGGSLRDELAYWRTQLDGCPPVLKLPTDAARPQAQTFRGAHESLSLPSELSESLKALSRREGATLFMTMLALLKIQLARAAGSEDIAVAVGIAGRQQVETERLIGCFINTLVMRTRLDGDPTFAELLGRVREVALGAYAHQGMPFQMLIEELLPAPDPRYPPLAQVSFALHNAARDGQQQSDADAGLRMDVSAVDAGRAAFDLTLRIQEMGQGMTCTMEYNTDLFLPATITRMLENYRRLSESVAGDAGSRLSELTAD